MLRNNILYGDVGERQCYKTTCYETTYYMVTNPKDSTNLSLKDTLLYACSVIFNPYGLNVIDTDWRRF
jgi:hypothetical protein